MPYRLLLHPHVHKALAALTSAERTRAKAALRKLEADPRTARSGVDIKKLKGTQGRQDLYRLRIGELRAVYAVEGRDILVTDLFRRGEGYEP